MITSQVYAQWWFSAMNMLFISYSVITIATDDLAMQWAGTHFSCDPFY